MFIIMNHESIYQTSLLFSCFVVVHSFSSDPSQLVINERYAQVEPIVFVPAIRIVNSEQEAKKWHVDETGCLNSFLEVNIYQDEFRTKGATNESNNTT